MTPDEDAYVHTMCSEPEVVGKATRMELFGTKSIKNLNTNTGMKLPSPEARSVDANKLKSLAKNYGRIPAEYHSYYPDVPHLMNMENAIEDEAEEPDKGWAEPVRRSKKQNQPAKQAASGVRKVGRSKGTSSVATGTASILCFSRKDTIWPIWATNNLIGADAAVDALETVIRCFIVLGKLYEGWSILIPQGTTHCFICKEGIARLLIKDSTHEHTSASTKLVKVYF